MSCFGSCVCKHNFITLKETEKDTQLFRVASAALYSELAVLAAHTLSPGSLSMLSGAMRGTLT
jgi:hypothetical protein